MLDKLKLIHPAGPCPSKIMLVADAPTAEEMGSGAAFSGYSMYTLATMLSEAGISLASCYRTHVLKIRAPGEDANAFVAMKKKEVSYEHVLYKGRHVLPILKDHIELLTQEINNVKPNVIVALGEIALWALTGIYGRNNGIHQWRSSIIPCDLPTSIGYIPKVIPTYPPRTINRMWSWRVVGVHDLKRIKKESEFHTFPKADFNFVLAPTFEVTVSVLKQLLNQLDNATSSMKLSVDIETKFRVIECIAIAWSKSEAICIPFMKQGSPHYFTEEQEAEILYLIYKVTTHAKVDIIGQNFTFDEQYIRRYWYFKPNLKRDTMNSQHSMFSVMRKDLSFLSSLYLKHHKHWKEDGKDDPPDNVRWHYNCEDAVKTYEIDEEQVKTIQSMKLDEVAEFQQRLLPHVHRMMHKGIKIDLKKRAQFDQEIVYLIAEREQYLKDILGYCPNIQSPAQMAVMFYEDLGQKPQVNKKTGSISTDDEALTKIAEKEPLLKPIVRCVSELRSLGVFLSTFIRAKLSENNRMHCQFKVAGTTTYRFASSANAFDEGTNLQNIPDGKRSTIALPNVRELFVPDEDHTWFDVDLDSADLRIVAWDADIQEMKDIVNAGLKVYVEVMKEYYKNPNMTKHDKEYTMFKSLCHGTNYLGTSKGLAERIGLLVHEVDKVQKWYYGKFPNLLKWQNSIKDQVSKRKMITNIFGYRMYFFDRIEGTIFNEAVAWKPQSTVACIINRGLVRLQEAFPEIPASTCMKLGKINPPQFDCLQQVHDSLTGQFPTARKEFFIKEIQNAVEMVLPYDDPLVIPAEVHTSEISWGHCK